MAKLKIELNDPQNIRDVLQEAFNLANEQILQSQNEINKLANATELKNEPMDAKSKYSKAINDYLSIKDKAISKKLEIAKLLSEIYKYNGDVKSALEQGGQRGKEMNFDFESIKKMVDDSFENKSNDSGTKTIKLNS